MTGFDDGSVVFLRIVPYLVAAGSLVLLLQPAIGRRREQRGRALPRPMVGLASGIILVVSDVLPAVLFAVLGTVVWHAMWPLAFGAIIGGLIGPAVARRVPAAILRVLIALCGLALAGSLVFLD